MRIAYLDCFAGISGDMFLAALIGAGVDPAVLHEAAAAMKLGATLAMETVDRSGIASVKVNVMVADAAGGLRAADAPVGAEDVDAFRDQRAEDVRAHQQQPKTQHLHKLGHSHSHEHSHEAEAAPHAHGRALSAIRRMIEDSTLEARVKRTAVRAFELLGESEAKIHNVPVEQIHFHEVGAVDAIVDIVAAAACIHALGAERWVASPINVGGGMVECAHGRFPVPAPATADLLRGMPTYSAHVEKELVTPTGAALLRVLVEEKALTFGAQPAMRVEQIGYGAGSRNPTGFPNVLRLSVGDADESSGSGNAGGDAGAETVTVIETALDDLSPQLLAHVAERALAMGALDVMLTPVLMKKGRPGTLLTILAEPRDAEGLEEMVLRESSTLGLRTRTERRRTLERSWTTVETEYGAIRMKVGSSKGETLNANPEFEDCRAAAAKNHVAVKLVHQAAIAAYGATLVAGRQGVGNE